MNAQTEHDSVFIQVYDMFVGELHEATRHLEAFERYDTRMEGWFQGQLIKTMCADTRAGWRLIQVGKKVGKGGGQPDLFIKAGNERLAIEIKSMVIGRRDLMMYFRKSFGKDLRKIVKSPWLVRLLTVTFPIVDESEWAKLTESAHSEYGVLPVMQKDIAYGQNRIARATLWKRDEDRTALSELG